MKSTRKRRRKIIGLSLLLGLILYFATLLWFLPGWIRSPINQRLANQNLQINYHRLWINPLTLNLHVQELELKDLTGELILSTEKALIDWQLWPLIDHHIKLESIYLEQAQINLTFNQNNKIMSPQLISTDESSSEWQTQIGQIEVTDSELTIKRLQKTLHIDNINLAFNLSHLHSHQSPSNLSLNTQPNGQLDIHSRGTDNSFQWKVTDWPLHSIAPWISTDYSNHTLSGQVSAEGSIEWPKNQLPIFITSRINLSINAFQRTPFTLNQAEFNAQDIRVDLNTRHLRIAQIKSEQGQLMAQIDPLEIPDYINNDTNQTQAGWDWQLDNMNINDWHISLRNNRPEVKLHISQLMMTSENNEKKIDLTASVKEPFARPISARVEGYLNPLRLKGDLSAENLTLKPLNPWIAEFNSWQIQHADLTVDSQFCVQDAVVNATGNWYIPALMVSDYNQRINAEDTTLQSIGINPNQRLVIFNDITTSLLEITQLNTENSDIPVNKTVNPPQNSSDNNLWRVQINQTGSATCDFTL